MLGLKKLKKDKKKLIIIEETEPIIESYSLVVEPTGEEMAWMANMPKPNTEAEMAGTTDKPDPANKEMVVKALMLEQKSQEERLKKMIMKKNVKKKRLVKKCEKPKKRIKLTIKGKA